GEGGGRGGGGDDGEGGGGLFEGGRLRQVGAAPPRGDRIHRSADRLFGGKVLGDQNRGDRRARTRAHRPDQDRRGRHGARSHRRRRSVADACPPDYDRRIDQDRQG